MPPGSYQAHPMPLHDRSKRDRDKAVHQGSHQEQPRGSTDRHGGPVIAEGMLVTFVCGCSVYHSGLDASGLRTSIAVPSMGAKSWGCFIIILRTCLTDTPADFLRCPCLDVGRPFLDGVWLCFFICYKPCIRRTVSAVCACL